MTQSPQVADLDDRHMSDDEIIDSIGAYEYGWRDSDEYSKNAEYGR